MHPAPPILVTTRDFVNTAIGAGLFTVLTEVGVRQLTADALEKGLDATPVLQQLSRCLVFTDGQREPQRVFVAINQDTADEIEKGALADLYQGYGEASRAILISKTGAEIKAQVLSLAAQQQAEAGAIQGAMTALAAAIGLAPPPSDAGISGKGSDGLGVLEVPTYPWRECEWGQGAPGSEGVRDAFAPVDAQLGRACKSAADAQNRRQYNEYAWQLRDNMRDQVMATRLAAALPAADTYRLPLPLVLALRFGLGESPAPAAGAGPTVEG